MSESKELTVPERAAVALGAAEHEKSLIELSKKYSDIVEIKNKAGREQAHAAYMTLKNARIAIENAGKDARDDAVKFGKAVIAEEKRLIEITQAEEARLQKLRDAWDAAVEVERHAKLAAEKARVDAIRKRIAEMQSIPSMLVGKQSATIAAAIEGLEAVQITLEDFAEFAGECEVAKISALSKMGEMLSAQLAHEAEAKRLQAEREELARLRAEQEERERIAAEERVAQEAKDRAARLEQERRDREVREQEEAESREAQRLAQEAIDAERAAHEARMAAERAELARQQAEIDRAKAEQERITREAAEKAEAERAAAAQAEADWIFAEQERIAAEQAAEAERKEREAKAEVERAALEAEVARLHALHFANDGLGMLEDVLQEIARPIGQDCCGHPEFDMGYVCCGNAEPIFHGIESLSTELNKWRSELIQRRIEQKEAA
jgi:hypothetical protein